MTSKLQKELEDIDEQLRILDDELNALKHRKRVMVDRKNQIERQLASHAEVSSQNFGVWESDSFAWSQDIKRVLLDVFKCKSFRFKQLSAINATMSGEDVLLTMPTGGGKSLTYQLPAIVQGGVTVVVSPLISLMEDQVYQLTKLGIDAALFQQSTTKEEANRINQSLTDKNGPIRLLYVTPEKLSKSKRIMAKLEKCCSMGLLKRIAIDEVHCCSVWGHDFRTDYKFLNVLKRQFKGVPIVGLTATASDMVLDDVKQMLGISAALVFRAPFNRPNLYYSIKHKPTGANAMNEEILRLLKGKFAKQTGIIYVFSRKEAQELSDWLRGSGVGAQFYHADVPSEMRTKVHESWQKGTTQVIVATIAFGMGIDKPNVRFVIHHSLPKSAENYYQESGRAGRDGQPAECILFYRLADVFRQSTMVCTEQTGQAKLYDMLRYCLNTGVCRRAVLAEHFGEEWQPDWCTDKCDVCEQRVPDDDAINPVKYVHQLHQCIRDASQKITGAKLVDTWLKTQPKKERMDQVVAEKVLAKLLLEGYLREDYHFTPYSIISYIQTGKEPPNSASCSSVPKRVKLNNGSSCDSDLVLID